MDILIAVSVVNCDVMKHYLVLQKVAGTLVSPERPFAAQGDWLQVIDSGLFAEFSLDVRVTPGIHSYTFRSLFLRAS